MHWSESDEVETLDVIKRTYRWLAAPRPTIELPDGSDLRAIPPSSSRRVPRLEVQRVERTLAGTEELDTVLQELHTGF